MKIYDFDFVVIGSGIAGLMSAIHLGRLGRVCVLTKKDSAESNTNYAQGGIACVFSSDDSFEEHVQDTLTAGAGLCDEKVVRRIVASGPARIAELEVLGMKFAEEETSGGVRYDLGREGGHSKRRVLHAGDITGREIEKILLEKARASKAVIMEHCLAIDLITTGWLGLSGPNRCVGGYFLNRRTGEISAFRAPHTVLATGGGGKVYLYTSNPDIATGDGLALAWRAGVPIKNMEFIQFHPTCLYHSEAKSFLISEAVRGEGAVLVDAAGKPFMERYDPRGSLAPRDIVARAIDREMKTSGARCVYLDIRSQSPEFLKKRFPNIYRTCKTYGFDMARDLVPVVPAAHYFCGGVEAAVDGATALPGLYACGEVACTGLHGANRLASNSLLEALVCAFEMSAAVSRVPRRFEKVKIPDWQTGAAVSSDESIVIAHNWNEVRTCLWDYVGIVRTNKRLERARRRIGNLRAEIQEYYYDYVVTADLLELRNIAAVGELIVSSAALRHESRGLHYTLDYPGKDNSRAPVDTVIRDKPGGKLWGAN
ncbi:MAG: L-aspartate oxidase [Kiritimatiellae bacterium]|nr:L-aspartate oxidase [Kiritimatiellia bacterium]